MPKTYYRLLDGTVIEADGAPVDSTLTISGAAADAKAVGDKFKEVSGATVKTVNGVEPDENGNVEIDIPEGGGGSGVTDISLGITGAAVGQIARITAVDDSGVPTAWEAVELPSGGGSETWDVYIKQVSSEALEGGFSITEYNGNPLKLKELIAIVKLQNGGTEYQWMGCEILDNNNYIYAGTSSSYGGNYVGAGEYAYFIYHAKVLPNDGRAIVDVSKSASNVGTLVRTMNGNWVNNVVGYYNTEYFAELLCKNSLGAGTSQGEGTVVMLWGKSI